MEIKNKSNNKFIHLEKREVPLYLDLRLIRNALTGLGEDCGFTLQDLIDLALEKNIVIQESEQ